MSRQSGVGPHSGTLMAWKGLTEYGLRQPCLVGISTSPVDYYEQLFMLTTHVASQLQAVDTVAFLHHSEHLSFPRWLADLLCLVSLLRADVGRLYRWTNRVHNTDEGYPTPDSLQVHSMVVRGISVLIIPWYCEISVVLIMMSEACLAPPLCGGSVHELVQRP